MGAPENAASAQNLHTNKFSYLKEYIILVQNRENDDGGGGGGGCR